MEASLIALAAKGSGIGVWALVLVALITLYKGWPALKKLSIEADGSLRKDLFDRIRDLEADLKAERLSCDQRLSDQEERHKNDIARLEGKIEGLMKTIAQNSQSSAHLMGDLRHGSRATSEQFRTAFPEEPE